MLPTQALGAAIRPMTTNPTVDGTVTGTPRRWLRIEGLAVLVAGVAMYLQAGGEPLWLLPLLLVPDVSMAGYLVGPRVGAFTYNLAHTWAAGLAVAGIGLALPSAPVVLAGAVLLAHTGIDRAAGYGVKYPTAFEATHLGRIGRAAR